MAAPFEHDPEARSGVRIGLTTPGSGRPLRLAVLIDADNASAKIADGLFQEIAAIGEASVRRIYGEYDFDTSPMYNGAFPDPSAGIQRMYWSRAAQKGVPFVNPTGYSDPEVDRDFEDAQTQNDPKKRWEDYADLQRRVMTDLSVVPLMEMRFVTVANRRVRNHTISADGLIGTNFATAWLAPVAG